MRKKIFIGFILLIIILNFMNANEKSVINSHHSISEQMHYSFSKQVSTDSIDYKQKSKNMLILGIIGIPTLVIGFGTEFAGGFIFGYFWTAEASYHSMEEQGGFVPEWYYYIKWIGLGIGALGSLIFIGGVVMTIVGFAMASYYKKNNERISFFINSCYENHDFKMEMEIKF